jgi:hypothetical protein
MNLPEAQVKLADAHSSMMVAAGYLRGAIEAYERAARDVTAVIGANIYADALGEVHAGIDGTRNMLVAGLEAMGPLRARVGMMANVN